MGCTLGAMNETSQYAAVKPPSTLRDRVRDLETENARLQQNLDQWYTFVDNALSRIESEVGLDRLARPYEQNTPVVYTNRTNQVVSSWPF